MDDVTITAVDELKPAERDRIVDGLIEYNAGRGFQWAGHALAVVARDDSGAVVGGLLGQTNLGWLFVSALWVDFARRGRGLGTALLEAAETEAMRRDCVGVYLDTYSFQAKPFYERLGYEVFGALAECPPGATKYYLSKALVGLRAHGA